MEFLYLLIAGALLYFFYRSLSNKIDGSNHIFEEMSQEIRALRSEIQSLKSQGKTQETKIIQEQEKTPVIITPPREEVKSPEIWSDPLPILKTEEVEDHYDEQTDDDLYTEEQYIEEEHKPSFIESFLTKNPDLEKFIGENLINKIGIIILVLGIGFFVKYAIDQNWINEIGRVAIGIFAGSILIGLAHRIRQSFTAFSSVLVGGGIAVFYFTIAIAFHQYHIFDQSVAFAIMVVITAFAIILSIAYNRIELAVIAILGGFTSPFMVSTGEGNYVVLFSYILILNAGILTLAYFKKWNLLNILSFVFTILLYGGWLQSLPHKKENGLLMGALVFATIFYVIFFLMNIINNIKQRARFNVFEISILMLNTSLYYAAGMYLLYYVDKGAYQGIFTFLVAVFNMGFAFALYRNQRVDTNLVYLLIGIVLTFISLTAPVQLEGNYITLFWAIESVLLLWFSQKSGLKQIKYSSMLVLTLMLISLCMDWTQIYDTGSVDVTHLKIILNKGFITGLISFVALIGYIFLFKNEEDDAGLKTADFRTVLKYVTGIVLYVFLLLELDYQLRVYMQSGYENIICTGIYNFSFLLTLNILYKRGMIKPPLIAMSVANFLFIAAYIVHYNTTVHVLLNEAHLFKEMDYNLGYYLHFVILGMFVVLIKDTYSLVLQLVKEDMELVKKILVVVVSFIVIYVSSSELMLIDLFANVSETDQDAYRYSTSSIIKAGFSILWGVCGFVFIFIGLKYKNQMLRIVALVLFAITLLKLFFYDLKDLSEGGKIISFTFLGVVLLVISFMYQRIKSMLLTDNSSENQQNES